MSEEIAVAEVAADGVMDRLLIDTPDTPKVGEVVEGTVSAIG